MDFLGLGGKIHDQAPHKSLGMKIRFFSSVNATGA